MVIRTRSSGSIVVAAALLLGCGADDDPGAGSCDAALRTGLVAQQTGVSVDAFDCEIVAATAKYHEPDAMLFKALIYVESRFDHTAAGCTNLPCGLPSGWTSTEAGCLGLMQVVAACGGTPDNLGMLPNGRPNMTTDPSSNQWPTSIFHPGINIAIGVSFLAGNRAEVEGQFSGCSVDQYTMMALSNYANHGSAKSCTEVNRGYIDIVLAAYRQYAAAAGYAPHGY